MSTEWTPPSPLSPSDERTWAMLAHLSVLLNLFSGFLGPVAALIILIAWVGGGVLVGIAAALAGVLSTVLIGLLCWPFVAILALIPLGALVYGVIGGIQCSQGQDFRYWLVGGWVRGTLTGA